MVIHLSVGTGIGERAGNAALEEVCVCTRICYVGGIKNVQYPQVIMALHVRKAYFAPYLGFESDTPSLTCVNTRELCRTSALVSELTGMIIPANKPIGAWVYD
jgi:2-isopropylmalate synthase